MAQSPLHKLSRGSVNLLTGWIEIPKNIYEVSIEENLTVGLTVGTVKGIGMAIVRTSAGVYEIVTFPFPIPSGYKPMIFPVNILVDECSKEDINLVAEALKANSNVR